MTADRTTADAWEGSRWVWYWILPAALVLPTIAALNATISPSHKILGVGVAILMAVGHLTIGPRIIEHNVRRNGVLYFAALCVGACVLFSVHPAYFFALFGLYPILFVVLEGVRNTIVFASILGVITAVGFAGWDGWTSRAWLQGGVQAAVSTIFSVALGLWISRIIDQSKQRNDIIRELEETQTALAEANRDAGIAAERERVSVEIHDTLAQGFTSLLMLTQAIDRHLNNPDLAQRSDVIAARKLLESAEHTARENLAEARSLVAALQPSALQSSSLADALTRLGERFEQETGISSAVTIEGQTRELPGNDDVVILRTAQEALANVRNHAAATNVTLTLTFGAAEMTPRVRLLVTDNGRGFTPELVEGPAADGSHGFGLDGMRRRARDVGGQVAIHSGIDEGTSVEVTLP